MSNFPVILPWSFAIACSNTSIFHYSLIINSIRTPTIGHNEYVMRSKLTTQFGILPFGFFVHSENSSRICCKTTVSLSIVSSLVLI